MFWVLAFLLVVAALALRFFFFKRERYVKDSPDQTGSDRDRAPSRLDTRHLSKEVEVAWEAGDLIEVGLSSKSLPSPEESQKGPRGEHTRVVLLARDPAWIYAYWDVAQERVREMREKHLKEWGLSQTVLRLYDLTPGDTDHKRDIAVEGADNWYINVDRPGHRFSAEIGRLFPSGFQAFARSNEVSLPVRGISMEISEEWAPLPWDSHYRRDILSGSVSSPMRWGKTAE